MTTERREQIRAHIEKDYGPMAANIWASEGGVLVNHIEGGNPIYILGTGNILYAIHNPKLCAGRSCVIHGPSDHHMRSWPTHWREDRVIMERLCPHGVGHPDPDDSEYRKHSHAIWTRTGGDTHGCDGCCNPDRYRRWDAADEIPATGYSRRRMTWADAPSTAGEPLTFPATDVKIHHDDAGNAVYTASGTANITIT